MVASKTRPSNKNGKKPWSSIEFWKKNDDNKVCKSLHTRQKAITIGISKELMCPILKMHREVWLGSLEWGIRVLVRPALVI